LGCKNQWLQGETQQKAFAKQKILNATLILALYDQRCPIKISADASSFGLGAILMQQHSNNQWKLVYSICLKGNNTHKTEISTEALAVTWACEKFLQYLLALSLEIKTNHKLLFLLLLSKQIDELQLRI